MPTYNYYCCDCDSHFSYFQKMSDLPISKCEKCNGIIKRLITGGTGLIFKGSGFYLTDYKKDKNPKSKKPNEQKNKNDKIKSDKKDKLIQKKENKSND